MYMHELIPLGREQVVVHSEEFGHTLVLTRSGAVYASEDTSDIRNMQVAFGALFTDRWRLATAEEIQRMRDQPDDRMLRLEWVKPEPRLRLV